MNIHVATEMNEIHYISTVLHKNAIYFRVLH